MNAQAVILKFFIFLNLPPRKLRLEWWVKRFADFLWHYSFPALRPIDWRIFATIHRLFYLSAVNSYNAALTKLRLKLKFRFWDLPRLLEFQNMAPADLMLNCGMWIVQYSRNCTLYSQELYTRSSKDILIVEVCTSTQSGNVQKGISSTVRILLYRQYVYDSHSTTNNN